MAHWLYMSLEAGGFLIFSAVMWLIIKRADTEREAVTWRQAAPAARPAAQAAPVARQAAPAPDRSGEVTALGGRRR